MNNLINHVSEGYSGVPGLWDMSQSDDMKGLSGSLILSGSLVLSNNNYGSIIDNEDPS